MFSASKNILTNTIQQLGNICIIGKQYKFIRKKLEQIENNSSIK